MKEEAKSKLGFCIENGIVWFPSTITRLTVVEKAFDDAPPPPAPFPPRTQRD
jgi:hypothetical protein